MQIYWIHFSPKGVGIQTTVGDGMPRSRCSNSGRGKDHTGSGAHPTSHSAGKVSSFPRDKATEAWRCPLAYIYCRSEESVEPCHPPNSPLWRALGKLYLYLYIYFYKYCANNRSTSKRNAPKQARTHAHTHTSARTKVRSIVLLLLTNNKQ
jgi:hypothetical protein